MFVGEFAARIEVLIKVMSVVGCPTADSWPGVDRRPGYTLHFPAWQGHSEIQMSSGSDSPRANCFPRVPDALLSRMAQENGPDGLQAMDLLQGQDVALGGEHTNRLEFITPEGRIIQDEKSSGVPGATGQGRGALSHGRERRGDVFIAKATTRNPLEWDQRQRARQVARRS